MFRSKKEPAKRTPWNKGKLVGQKAQSTMQKIWSIQKRVRPRKTLDLSASGPDKIALVAGARFVR